MVAWKRELVSGLAVITPIIITTWVLVWVYEKLTSAPLIGEAIWIDVIAGDSQIAEFVGLILTIIAFGLIAIGIGYFMRTAIGRVVEGSIDEAINRVPGLRIVYNASKTAAQTAVAENIHQQTPVRLELWGEIRLTAFKTGKQTESGRELVFVPTAPNVTSGFLMDVDPENLTETTEPVEDALARILSGGFGGPARVSERYIESGSDSPQQQ